MRNVAEQLDVRHIRARTLRAWHRNLKVSRAFEILVHIRLRVYARELLRVWCFRTIDFLRLQEAFVEVSLQREFNILRDHAIAWWMFVQKRQRLEALHAHIFYKRDRNMLASHFREWGLLALEASQ